MTPEIPTSQPRRVKKNRGYLWIAGIVILILIAGGTLYFYPTVALNRELAAIRQKGEPLTTAEAAPPPVPQSQNAAPLYRRAAAAMKGVGDSVLNPRKLSAKKTAELLHQNVRTIQLIRQATAKPKCLFNMDWKEDTFASPTYTYDLMTLLRMQASYEARADNTNQALSDVRCLFLMAHHMSLTPDTITIFKAIAMDEWAEITLAKVLLSVPLTTVQAHTFEASLPVTNWNAAVHRALLMGRAYRIDIFNQERSHPDDVSREEGLSFHLAQLPINWQEADALRLWREDITLESNAPIPIPPDYSKHIDQELDHISPFTMYTMILSPPAHTIFMRKVDWMETLRREREIALALTVYHTKYHYYPTSLAPAEKLWKSTFPNDPFSGKPFRYKSDGKTFLLYSIGVNRVDNGGKFEAGWGNQYDDIAWKNGSSKDNS